MSPRPRVPFAGSLALVTGATGGLGEAIATALSDRGVRLIVSGRREAELEALAARLGARPVVADLSVRHDVDQLRAEAAEADILVANAALPATGRMDAMSRAEIDNLLEVNLRSPIVMAQDLSARMAQRGRGQLVFIGSLSGKAASPVSSMYATTKFGLRGFALSLRQDLAPAGVGVSLISPGFIRDAGMFHESGTRLPPGTGTRAPSDVARAVIRAIEQDRAEIEVAPPQLRAGAAIASLAPGLAERGSRLLGSHRIAEDMARRQRDKR
jgi:short-subunit dehydrogenase